MNQYDKSHGVLWINNRREKENHPHHRGFLEISRELIKDMVNQVNEGKEFAKIEIKGWNKHTERAGDFISLGANPMFEKSKEQPSPQPSPQPASQPAPQTSHDKIPF